MTTDNPGAAETSVSETNPRNYLRADTGSNEATSTPETADNGLMTAQRPPGRDSERVGFAAFAAAFVLDVLLHVAVGVAAWYAVSHSPGAAVGPIVAGVVAGTAASFVHRTLLQRLFRTTVGKAVFGLQLRQADGSYPSLWRLVKQWFHGVLATIGAPLQILG